ncbi:MAG: GIY-YIG nuclease family protein [Candidatus Omnitrophica bacterium]|nr:GIY-YIG nuclease family protein [Candidatus Omnitrophota bacterium]MBI5023822.1 GIY-YIG nuclease family protein [Candidatus Omnitrophota bacterium]
MYCVYALWSCEDKRFYIGYTADLKRRIHEHQTGQCHSTIRMRNPLLVFYEAFGSQEDAQRREGYLKTTKGKRALKLMLRNTLAGDYCPVV